jgi:hypothetical protein
MTCPIFSFWQVFWQAENAPERSAPAHFFAPNMIWDKKIRICGKVIETGDGIW